MKNAEALHCWEVVATKAPLLTIHNAPRARAVEHAEREALRLSSGSVIKLRQVARCTCHYQNGGAQPAHGPVAKIVSPPEPRRYPGPEPA